MRKLTTKEKIQVAILLPVILSISVWVLIIIVAISSCIVAVL